MSSLPLEFDLNMEPLSISDLGGPALVENHPVVIDCSLLNRDELLDNEIVVNGFTLQSLVDLIDTCDLPSFEATVSRDERSSNEASGSIVPSALSTHGFDSADICGMEFKSDSDAFEFYKSHGKSNGFDVRRGRSKSSSGKSEVRYFVCNREGYATGIPGDRQRHRASFRCGCKAAVRFIVNDGHYKCTMHIMQHNHPFTPEHQKHFLKAARKIDDQKKNMLLGLLSIGIKSIDAWRIMVHEAGGIESVGFSTRDMWNLLSKEKIKTARSSDAQMLLDYFVSRSNDEGNFLFRYDVVEGRLNNFYWRDSLMLVDYDVFGDVVVFDTTYRTNMYGMVCCPFVGINNHGFTVIFCCGFLVDEKADTFGWLFDCFLEGVAGKQPITFMTDQDKAMAIAVEKHLPLSKHRLCLWHITQNARKHLGWLLNKNEDFERMFYFCLYRCLSEDELLQNWGVMIDSFELHDNEWLGTTLDLRSKWCPAISADCFSAGLFL